LSSKGQTSITPFIGFCIGGDLELIKLALLHGGKINQSYVQLTGQSQGNKNYTALQAAVAYGETDVVSLLLANGGDPSMKDQSGRSCLELAEAENYTDVIALLNANLEKPNGGNGL
jgi:ankyrin repeat protein